MQRELREQDQQRQSNKPGGWMSGYSAGFNGLPSPAARSGDRFETERAYLQQSVRAPPPLPARLLPCAPSISMDVRRREKELHALGGSHGRGGARHRRKRVSCC